MGFHGFSWFQVCYKWFQVGFHGSRSVSMVFHGSRLVFMVSHGSRSISCFFMVPGWYFMVPGRFSWVFMVQVGFHGFSFFQVGFSCFFSKMYPPKLYSGPTIQSRSAARRAAQDLVVKIS